MVAEICNIIINQSNAFHVFHPTRMDLKLDLTRMLVCDLVHY